MLLLDPLLLTPPRHPSGKLSSSPEFWNRVLDWARDRRVYVGQETHALIYEEYAKYGYPDQNLDLRKSPARREYQAALNMLLSRVQRHERESSELSFSPGYLGSPEHHLALQLDVSGTAGTGIRGIATEPSHWTTSSNAQIGIDPPPPPLLEACYRAGAPLQAEQIAKIRSFFSDKRLHIVGGQIDKKVISTLCSRLAIENGEVVWLACEKAKPPRDLDKRWKMLDGERDITICITGRVGHATSKSAARASELAGAPHILVEFPAGIEQALVNHAAQNG